MNLHQQANPDGSKKVWQFLFNWVTWFGRALPDSVAQDIGDEYQSQVAFFVIATFLLVFILPTAVGYYGAHWLYCLLYAIAAYLVIGAVYLVNNRNWNM